LCRWGVVLMAGTFADRIDVLRERIGNEKITASVLVDQRYAHYQSERLDLVHPRGGGAKYLERPLMSHYRDYLDDYAKTVLDDGGVPAMKRSAEHLSDQVEVTAPVEFTDLRRSGHPSVTQGDRTVYDRPPKQHRLSEEELKAKGRARIGELIAAGLPWFFTRHGKVVRVPGKGERRG
jgi:hypothetical protein